MDEESRRREAADAWYPIVARYVTLFSGLGILAMQQFGFGGDNVALTVAGIALCGPVVAQSAATIFASLRGGGTE